MPVQRLEALLKLHHLYFGKSAPADRLKIEGALAEEIQMVLVSQGYLSPRPKGFTIRLPASPSKPSPGART